MIVSKNDPEQIHVTILFSIDAIQRNFVRQSRTFCVRGKYSVLFAPSPPPPAVLLKQFQTNFEILNVGFLKPPNCLYI